MRIGNSRGTVAIAWLVITGLTATAGTAAALDLARNFDDGGGTDNWTEAANWDPDTAGGPYNIGAIHFFVTIPDGELVIFDRVEPVNPGDPGPPTQLDALALGNDARLQLNPDTELEILGDADIAGILDARGGHFTALDPTGALTGNRARVYASAGGSIDLADETFDSTGMWRSWDPSGSYGDQSGTWYPELIKAEGAGSRVVMSSILSINADFSSSGNDHSYQQIEAIDGGVIDLSGVETIVAPRSGRDSIELISSGTDSRVDFQSLTEIEATYAGETHYDNYIVTAKVRVTDGGSMDLSSLSTIGRTGVEVGGGSSLELPQLATVVDSTFTASGGSTITGSVGFGTYSSTGIWDSWDASGSYGDQTGYWYPDLMKAEGTDSQLLLPSIQSIDASIAPGGNDYTRQRIRALDGGVIDLSGVQTITTAQTYRGSLEIISDADSSIDLSGLIDVVATYHGETNNHGHVGTARINASNGGTIDLSSLTSIDRAMIEASGGSPLALPQLATVVDSTFSASGGSTITAGEALGPYEVRGLWDSWDASGSYGDQSGSWSLDLIKAEGAGSQVLLPALQTIDAGFSSGGNDHTYQQIRALDGGVIDLSGVNSIVSPNSGRDRLNIIVNSADSELRLDALTQIEGRTGEYAGTTRIILSNNASVAAPLLNRIENAWFDLASGATLTALGTGGVFSTLGNWDSWDASGSYGDQTGTWYPDLIKVEGTGSRLELPSVVTIDAGFASGGNDHNYQQLRALDGGVVDLSGVKTIITPVSSRDRLDIVASGADSLVDLSGLQQISHGGRHARIEASGGGEVILGSLFALDSSFSVTAADADSTLRVLGSIHKNPGNLLAGSSGANLHVGGRFSQEETDPTRLPLGDKDNGGARVIMDGTADRLLEVGGTDVSTAVGFLPDGNFGFGQLVVGADGETTTVRLLDVADNGHRGGLPEALYLYGVEMPVAATANASNGTEPARENGLKIGSGSTLVLNDLNVYAWDESAGVYVDIKALFGEGVTSIPYDQGTIELRRGSAVAGDVWHRPGRVSNGAVDDADVTLMLEAARGDSPHERFDLDEDGDADLDDVDYLLHTILETNHGDANLDGVVDVIDLGRLGLRFGQVGDLLWGDADFNADRFVDVIDLGVLGLNFGALGPPASDAPVVTPEPASLTLLLLSGLALYRSRRRG